MADSEMKTPEEAILDPHIVRNLWAKNRQHAPPLPATVDKGDLRDTLAKRMAEEAEGDAMSGDRFE